MPLAVCGELEVHARYMPAGIVGMEICRVLLLISVPLFRFPFH